MKAKQIDRTVLKEKFKSALNKNAYNMNDARMYS